MQQPDGWLAMDNVLELGPTRSLTPILECSTRTLAKGKGRTLTVDQARHIAYLLERRVSEIWPELTPIDQDPKRRDWSERAKCRGVDQSVFFPGGSGTAVVAAYEAAKRRYCHQCPVVAECLEEALLVEERVGVECCGLIGGRTPKEREFLIRARKDATRKAHG